VVAKPTVTAPKVKTFNKSETRTLKAKSPRFYPADDVKQPLPSNKHKHKPTRLRKTLTPGTVIILLAGRFQGRRVVFLKQLPSGLLLVNGPFDINGVPLRRVNQAYVIATTTKVDVSGIDLSKFDDKHFAKQKQARAKKSEGEFLSKPNKEKPVVSKEKKEMQEAIDAKLVEAVKKVPLLSRYLKVKFTLRNGMHPHQLHW